MKPLTHATWTAALLLAAALPTLAAPDAPAPAPNAPVLGAPAVPDPLAPPAVIALPAAPAPVVPADLPGRGIAQHDFFYAGEAKDRQMFIVRGGKIVWSYDDPTGRGEISDATLLSNGNVLFAHQFAVELINPDKKVLWRYDAPPGTEVHTAIPIGTTHVLFIQNGGPATVHVVNIVTGVTEKQFNLSVVDPRSVHGQFRHARLTDAGTLMVAHMDAGKLSEYDTDGKELWTLPSRGIWGVNPLKNGHLLITDNNGTHEIDRTGKVFWSVTRADLPGYTLKYFQEAWRLPNGNTLINNWVNQWEHAVDPANAPVQALEITPDKKIVWALHSWTDPNLGPSTTIQILDTPTVPENVHFGDIK